MSKDRKIRVGNFDIETGEIIEGVLALHKTKSNPYNNGWLVMSQEPLKMIAEDKEIKGEALRIFIYIAGILDFENWIYIPQKEIGNALDINKQQVSRSIKKLVEKEIILKGKKQGHSFTYRLNPYFGWKGQTINLDKYREERDQQRIKDLKNKIDKKRQRKIELLSKKYNIPIEELNYIYD